jgi:acyl-coenzyme A synthetase/AMP-(fatty) acid ligase
MNDTLTHLLHRITGSPPQAFIAGGQTVADICRLAAGICSRTAPDEPLCLWTQDKIRIAAALLAAACGGPRIIIPYAFSPQALDEARSSIPFSKILAGDATITPAGCSSVIPESVLHPEPLRHAAADADIPRIMLFTGGSTGTPKLWSKTARNLFGEALLLAETFGIGPHDCILSTVPPQHIYGLLFSVLVPLVSGCSVLEPVYCFPQEILAAARTARATILVSVPPHYHVLQTDSLQPYALRLAFSSAGMLPAPDAGYFHEKTGIAVTEIYGSTETGGIAWKASPADSRVCRTFKGIDWKIHNGRLLVRSAFLSPELRRDQDGFFTTADRAEACGADSFTLHGRADDIVKVGGRRVDLSEICDKVKTLAGVQDAVVFAMQARTGRGSDIAALIAGRTEAAALRAGLAEICEPYAMPRHIRIVESIPVLPTGKHDRETIKKFFTVSCHESESGTHKQMGK